MATYVDLSTLFTPVPRAIVPSTWASQIRENLTFLHENRRVICTSSTRPTGFEGLEIYETDTDKVYVYNGTSWIPTGMVGPTNTWTPTLTQSGTVTKTVNIANYWKIGRRVEGEVHMTATGAGGGSTDITVGIPDTSVYSGSPSVVIGNGYVFDASAGGGTWYSGMLIQNTTTTAIFSVHNSLDQIGSSPTFTLASSDQISYQFRYYSTT